MWIQIKAKEDNLEGLKVPYIPVRDKEDWAWIPEVKLDRVINHLITEKSISREDLEVHRPVIDISKVSPSNINDATFLMIHYTCWELAEIIGLDLVRVSHAFPHPGNLREDNELAILLEQAPTLPGGAHPTQLGRRVESLTIDGEAFTLPERVGSSFLITSKEEVNEVIITDDNNVIIAYADKGTIWIPFSLTKEATDPDGWVFDRLFRAILARALFITPEEQRDKDPEARKRHLEECRIRFRDVYTFGRGKRIDRLESEISSLVVRRQELENEIDNLILQSAKISRELELEKRGDNEHESADKEFQEILDSCPNVESLEFTGEGETLIVKTSMMYLMRDVSTRPEGEKTQFDPIPLGRFKITLTTNPSTATNYKSVWIENLTTTLEYRSQKWYHPHINATSGPCLGRGTNFMTDCVASREYAQAITVALDYIENIDTLDTWGRDALKPWQDHAEKTEQTFEKEQRAKLWRVAPSIRRNLRVKVGDKVITTCLSCPLYDKKDSGGVHYCPIREKDPNDITRVARVALFTNEFVGARWEVDDQPRGCEFPVWTTKTEDGEPIEISEDIPETTAICEDEDALSELDEIF